MKVEDTSPVTGVIAADMADGALLPMVTEASAGAEKAWPSVAITVTSQDSSRVVADEGTVSSPA